MTRVDLFFFCLSSFKYIHLSGEEEGMAAGPVLGTKVFTHLQEREGKGKNATQMRPMKRTDWINSWWERGTEGGREGRIEGGKGKVERREEGSEGKPFHQVLEIQAAGS